MDRYGSEGSVPGCGEELTVLVVERLSCLDKSESYKEGLMISETKKRSGVVARLELRYHSEDRRYFLLGHPLENGDTLEFLRGDGTWVQGTFLWSSFDNASPLLISGDPDSPESARFSLSSETLLRWPHLEETALTPQTIRTSAPVEEEGASLGSRSSKKSYGKRAKQKAANPAISTENHSD
jgi:hypothetical protein